MSRSETFQSGKQLTLSQLESLFWKTADILRSGRNTPEYRDLTLGLLFLKRLSDSFNEEREEARSHHLSKGKTTKEAEQYAESKNEYRKTYFVPKEARWEEILSNKTAKLSTALNLANEVLEKEHQTLRGLLCPVDYSEVHRVTEASLQEAASFLSQFRLDDANLEGPDIFSTAWRSIQSSIADQEGKKGGEHTTPKEVSRLLAQLTDTKEGMSFYDPACGSGGILLEVHKHFDAKEKSGNAVKLAGQEVNPSAYRTAKLNLIVEGVEHFDIRYGNTLTDPQHLHEGQIAKFDRIASSPPFGLSNWGYDQALSDPYERFIHGIPPKASGDLAFIEHMVASVKDDGVICAITTNGVLLRGGVEGEIRKGFVDADLVEAVISLPPSLYTGTGIPISIIVFSKNKSSNRKGKVLFIDASHECDFGRTKNTLRDIDIQKIVACHEKFSSEPPYAKVVEIDEIASNKYCLTVKKYADCSPEKIQAERLLAQYRDYKLMSLREMTSTVQQVRQGESFEEIDNSILIPKAGIHKCSASLSRFQAKHHHSFQLTLNTELVLAEYLEIFLHSELGTLTLKGISYGSIVPMMKWEGQLSDANIPVPKLKNQRSIIAASNRLETLKRCIEELEQNLALSPLSTNAVLEQTESMLSAVGGLTDAERVMSLVRQGESGHCEFKESFALDLRKGTQEKYIEVSSLKTIAAFLNTDGGTLLIGVEDEGGVPGLAREIDALHKGKRDKFLLHFKNQLKSKIGEEFYPFIKHRTVLLGDSEVLIVEVSKASKACFLDGKDFYVRTNPATDKLEGPKLVEYIQNHFS